MPAAEFILSFRAPFSWIIQDLLQGTARYGVIMIFEGTTIRHASTCAGLGESGNTMTRKNADLRMTGNWHQIPADSYKGQKRTAINRYKLPVGL